MDNSNTQIGKDLIVERINLSTALSFCEPGAFPGSRESRRENEALMALVAFDKAHPEVIAKIQADRSAEIDANTIPAGGR